MTTDADPNRERDDEGAAGLPMDSLGMALLSEHCREQLQRRGIGEQEVRAVLSSPQQRLPVREGRVVVQSRVLLGEPPREYLLRVFVDVDRSPAVVVTAYRTGKVTKYWSAR